MHQNHVLVPLCQIWFKYQISEPTSRGLLARGATCLYGLPTYLQGTVCQAQPVYTISENTSRGLFAMAAACFPSYLKATPGDCRPQMQPVYIILNPTYRGMSVQGVACRYGFKTYLRVTVGWRCSQFIRFLNLFRNV